MKHISKILPNVLTEVKAQPTKAPPSSTADWAKWLQLETLDDPELKLLVDKCGAWIRRVRMGAMPSWISIIGKSGTGKTHCGERLWDFAQRKFEWWKMDYNHHKIYWPDFVQKLRSGEHYGELTDMKRWPVLFLDDIGAERDTTGFAGEQLNTLLGCRTGKWTIITSNLNLEQLAEIDPRIADRIIREPGNEYIEITTQSYAVRKM